MRAPFILAILMYCGSAACLAQASDPAAPAAKPVDGEPRIDSHASIGLRPRIAGMQLHKGVNTIYTNKDGWTLQAVVDRRGAISGYLQVNTAGKTSKVHAQTPLSPPLKPGQMALVHKCVAITQECLNNPLPPSGNPDDCMIQIQCPNTALSNLLTR
jgi:hypothetical protein